MFKRRLFAAFLSISLIFSNGISSVASENIDVSEEISVGEEDGEATIEVSSEEYADENPDEENSETPESDENDNSKEVIDENEEAVVKEDVSDIEEAEAFMTNDAEDIEIEDDYIDDNYGSGYIDTGDRIDYYSNGRFGLYQSSSLPSTYDARNYGYITSVKNQGNDGTCWAFSALGAGEAALIKNGYYNKSNIDLSELQLAYFFYNKSSDPLGNISNDYAYITNNENFLSIGGNNYYTVFELAAWRGAADESLVPYGNASTSMTLDNKYAYISDKVHLQNSYIISMQNIEDVKKAIMNYGAVASAMYSYPRSYFNKVDSENWAFYQNSKASSDHGIMVIGWDDNYSKDNFYSECRPSSDGAWLIKNSWGAGNKDYVWVSYEDASLSRQDAFIYIFENANNYDYNYQYDGGYAHHEMAIDNGNGVANIYTVNGSAVEELDAVSIALADSNIRYELQIYYNPDEDDPLSGEPVFASPQTGTTTYAGYYTIKLNKPVLLAKGDRFSVVFTLYDDDDSTIVLFLDGDGTNGPLVFESSSEEHQSYLVNVSQGYISDFYNRGNDYCARVKAFTTKASAVNLSNCSITSVGSQAYTGSAVKPLPVLTYNGVTLKNGSDYTISYKNNTLIGTATMTITGKGRFTGSKTINYDIKVFNYQTTYNGVDYSAVYDNNYYVTKYPDIWKAYGTDTSKVLAHFVNNGMGEGRQASEEFNVTYYKNRYADLRNAFGTDLKKYYLHYISNGKKEKRDAKTPCAAPSNTNTGTTTNTNTGTTNNGSNTGTGTNSSGTSGTNNGSTNGTNNGSTNDTDNGGTSNTNNNNSNTNVTTNVDKGLTVLDGVDYSAVYNYYYYIGKYADLKAAFGNDQTAALRHFVNNGMNEGRQASEDFNVTYYRNRYADLRGAFGTNLKNYYMHYINNGVKEGRDAKTACAIKGGVTILNGVDYSAVYDFNYYINKYPDIKAAFGYDDVSALQHFVNNGMKEGRIGKADFVVSYYKNSYPDLRSAFGSNLQLYYLHYIKNGKREGRIANVDKGLIGATTMYNGVDYSSIYDYNFYVQRYPDIKAAFGGDDYAVIAHFVNNGMNEGRQAKATFNVNYYKSNYVDLQKVFGNNLKLYYIHYINNGIREGRTADKLLKK